MKHKPFLVILASVVLLISVVMMSCKKGDGGAGPPPAGGGATISGAIQAFGGQPIAGAQIQFFTGSTTSGTPTAAATSDTSGQWQLSLNSGGRYTCVVSATNFPSAIVTVIVTAGQNQNLGVTILDQGILNGIVDDAQTGQPVANAVVRFFAGSNLDTLGVIVGRDTTDGLGQWTLTLTLGNYICVVNAPGRLTLVANVPITDTATTQLTSSVSGPLPAGQMRIILNWGRVPSDLDSHLTGDSTSTPGSPRYHANYFNRVVQLANGDTVAYLDHDDVTSYGPETITIFRFFPGTLRYKIHDYSNRNVTGSHYMSDSSEAVVRVFTSAGQIREDRIVTGKAGNQWYVYDINGSNQAITFVNTVRDSVSSPSDTSFLPIRFPEKKMKVSYDQ